MSAALAALPELTDTVDRQSRERLAVISRGLAELFVAGSANFSFEQIELFDIVFMRLIERIETRSLVDLGERLASAARPPPDSVHALALHEEIAVAEPLLERCETLPQSDLVHVIERGGNLHRLAISRRRTLAEVVTDALLAYGDVLRSIGANAGAKFSPAGLKALAASAAKDGVLAERLARRLDVPTMIFCQMLAQATEIARVRFMAAATPELQEQIRDAIQIVARKPSPEALNEAAYGEAMRRLAEEYPDGNIDEIGFLRIVLSRRREDAIAALAMMAKLPASEADRIVRQDRLDTLMTVCKAVGFDWKTVRALIQLRSGRAPRPDVLTKAFAEYKKMTQATARQVVQFWRTQAKPAAQPA